MSYRAPSLSSYDEDSSGTESSFDDSGEQIEDVDDSASESESLSEDETQTNPPEPSEEQVMQAQMDLLQCGVETDDLGEITTTPIFTEPARKHGVEISQTAKSKPFTQYGLLAGDISGGSSLSGKRDPRIFQNIAAPSSTFICGSQGSGKSHTLSCVLENCLVQSVANVLPRPLTGLVFHYDTFISDTGGSPCEAAYLSSNPDVKVRVFCPPTNIKQLKRIYSKLPNVTVEELRINQTDLNTKRMLDLMAVSSIQGGSMPLYLHVVSRILRDLRIQQQTYSHGFNYAAFKKAIDAETLTEAQMSPLQQRLTTLESFMVDKEANSFDLFRGKFGARGGGRGGSSGGHKKKKASKGNDWSPKPSQLTIVDLSCPCVTAEMACSLFNICLSLFLEQSTDVGRVIALDEAHKYMTDSAECMTLTENLLATIRLQRHLAARVIISTQEPSISPRLLDLCSVTIVHRFTSPDWLETLKKHLAGASSHLLEGTQLKGDNGRDTRETSLHEGAQALTLDKMNIAQDIFSRIIALRPGEALMFAPSAIIGVDKRVSAGFEADFGIGDLSLHNGREEVSGGVKTTVAQVQAEPVRLGHGVLKVRIRQRVTADGGRSILAQ